MTLAEIEREVQLQAHKLAAQAHAADPLNPFGTYRTVVISERVYAIVLKLTWPEVNAALKVIPPDLLARHVPDHVPCGWLPGIEPLARQALADHLTEQGERSYDIFFPWNVLASAFINTGILTAKAYFVNQIDL